MMLHDINIFRALWIYFWLTPMIDHARGKISTGKMIWRYLLRVYFVFILPLLFYGIYIFATTPDYVWARPKPTTYEESYRQEQPSIFQ